MARRGKATRTGDLFDRLVRVLLDKGSDRAGTRIGFDPLAALVDISPRVARAFARLDSLTKVEAAWPQGRLAHLRIAGARRQLMRELDALTDAQVTEARRRLREVAGQVESSGSNQRLREAARNDAEARFPADRGRGVTGAVPRSTAFDLVERAAAASDEIGWAQHAFERALMDGDSKWIRESGSALQDALTKYRKDAGLSAVESQRARSAIGTVVRSFERTGQTPSARAVRQAVAREMKAVADDDPVAGSLRRVLPWISVHDWPSLMETLARIPPVSASLRKQGGEALAAASRWRVGALKGASGDMVARQSEYRRIRMAEVNRATRFLESPAGRGWEGRIARTPVRATVDDKTRFALSYDDSVLLVNTSEERVIVVMSAQFKAGDASSLKGLAQTERDIIREAGGKLLVDGQQFTIQHGVLRTRRVFVGTQLAVHPNDSRTLVEQLGTREVDFVKMPTDPADLDAFATFLLRAAGIIP